LGYFLVSFPCSQGDDFWSLRWPGYLPIVWQINSPKGVASCELFEVVAAAVAVASAPMQHRLWQRSSPNVWPE